MNDAAIEQQLEIERPMNLHAQRRRVDSWTTNDGRVIAWADLDERHLWNIVRMLVRQARKFVRSAARTDVEINEALANRCTSPEAAERVRKRGRRRVATVARVHREAMQKRAAKKRRDISIAIDELAHRGALPDLDDLRAAWDRACGGDGGPNDADNPERRPWCLVELWVGYRGASTLSPGYLEKPGRS